MSNLVTCYSCTNFKRKFYK